MRTLQFLSLTFAVVLFSACSSTPKVNQSSVSQKEAEVWLQKYCSKYRPQDSSQPEVFGDIVMRSSTKEFKGQYPASIHYEKNGSFMMEVTNILGGTMMRLTGSPQSIEILVPSKPQFNRKGVTHYMGLELPILAQLLRGDLPCPNEKSKPQVDHASIVLQTSTWKWVFDRATVEDGLIPVRVRLVAPKETITLTIEDWNRSDVAGEQFAKKVVVQTIDGELKWTWRSRDLK